jgi:hypothetical protein
MNFDGIPLMSPNCWRAIEDAVAARAPCRYLEWGSGNSTIALLRAALQNRGGPRLELHSIESDRGFASALFDAMVETFHRASVDGLVRVEPLRYPKPSLLEALRSDPGAARYEAQFLKVLWHTRNDRFWAAEPRAVDLGRWGGVRRHGTTLRCSAAFRLERVRRALAPIDMTATETKAGTVQSPPKPPLRPPTLVTFDTEPVRLQFLVIPQLRNRLWREGPILDGLYEEYADYVSAPLEGRFDVVLVDGRARTSCLKRIYHDRLLAPGGVLFLHDAHRPSQQEGLQLFSTSSYVRGTRSVLEEDSPGADEAPTPPQVWSGTSIQDVEAVFDRELYFYVAPIEDDRSPVTTGPCPDAPH